MKTHEINIRRTNALARKRAGIEALSNALNSLPYKRVKGEERPIELPSRLADLLGEYPSYFASSKRISRIRRYDEGRFLDAGDVLEVAKGEI